MFEIKQASLKDMDYIISLARSEGWNPGLYDSKNFFVADNNGFFIATLDTKPIGSISAVKYGANYGFIGLFIIEKEYRQNGYGIELWKHALKYLEKRNIGLDGVLERVDDYKKWGFNIYHNDARYLCKLNTFSMFNKNVLPADKFNIKDLNSYDKRHFGTNREVFFSNWINQPESKSYCYYKAGKIAGFGTIRKAFDGYKIGPLYAFDKNIAEAIFLVLASEARGADVFLDVNEDFQPAMDLVKKYEMKRILQTKRMYTKGEPISAIREVFGLTTLALG